MKRNDFILAAVIIIISVFSIFAMRFFSKEGDYVVITVDGVAYASFALSDDRVIRIGESGPDYNTINIEDKKVYISDADCPDRICVNHRPISKTGETIVCLPHRLSVTIKQSETDDYSFDAVSE
ncbi:MAG: NusG domain II-containing protein [Lachnospiraceae bacterium]|nr:NusG domain II-containing protein [Lachnospiraceae bacterium]